MTRDEMQFREHLAYYGSDIDSWPEAVRPHGHHMQHYPECAALLTAEKRFEHLMRHRHFEPMHTGLSSRIMAAAQVRGRAQARSWWATASAPAAAIAATLVLGFIIGYGAISSSPQAAAQASLIQVADDDGAML